MPDEGRIQGRKHAGLIIGVAGQLTGRQIAPAREGGGQIFQRDRARQAGKP